MARLVVVVPVVNERSLVDGFVSHHRRIGVAHQLFLDLGSADGTSERLCELAADDDVTVVEHETDVPFHRPEHGRDSRWYMFARAMRDHGADWVTWLDADERLVVDRDSVVDWLPSTPTVIVVPRFNAVFASPVDVSRHLDGEVALSDVPVVVRPERIGAKGRFDPDSLPWTLSPVAGRVVAPAVAGMHALLGGHDVAYDGAAVPRGWAQEEHAALTVHLPFTSRERFERKVAGLAGLVGDMSVDSGTDAGWHWHRWVRFAEEGRLASEFDRQFMSPEDATRIVGRPVVTTVANGLDLLRGDAPRPVARRTQPPPPSPPAVRTLVKDVFPVAEYPDVRLVHGDGSWVTDADGTRYLDLNSGQFCAAAGHSSPVLRTALAASLDSLQDTHTGMLSIQAERGLAALGRISDLAEPYSVLLSTGSEATEFALRYAKHLKEKDGVIALDVGYHGITHGAAGYSMSRARVRPPMPSSFAVPAPRCRDFAGSGDHDCDEEISALADCLDRHGHEVAAMVIEPIISGGGMFKVPQQYLDAAVDLCHAHDVFVVYDECQTGAGRLGRWYSYTDRVTKPDFVVTGKSLGLGMPVSAVTARGETVDLAAVTLGHFSSHQNEPFAGTIVESFVDWMVAEQRLQAITDLGAELLGMLVDRVGERVIAPRGEGLMLGFDLTDDEPGPATIATGDSFVRRALHHGLLLQHCNYGRTIRLLPNYTTTPDELDEFVKRLEGLLDECR